MTGIERLRTLAGAWDAYGLGGALGDVARQIERERACDADTTENVRLVVGGVVDEMERHILGHEGMDDSPVARWARELREALGGHVEEVMDVATIRKDAYDAYEWVEAHGGLDVVSRALTPSAKSSNRKNFYDRLALGWIEDNGGLDHVRSQWGYLKGRANHADHVDRQLEKRQRQIDESHAALRRRNEERRQYAKANKELLERCAAMKRRLMPEGMEWLVEAWPRFEDGEPVRSGDKFAEHGGCENIVCSVEINDFWFKIHGFDGADSLYGKRSSVKRPAPKVLDADGVEIRAGDRVWSLQLDEPHEWTVLNPRYGSDCVLVSLGDRTGRARPENLVHHAPVLAADGKPLRVGETVWLTDGSERHVVLSTEKDAIGNIVTEVQAPGLVKVHISPSRLTHERPVVDTWERLEKDSKMDPGEYCETYVLRDAHMGREAEECAKASDLVRRAKKLAERDA